MEPDDIVRKIFDEAEETIDVIQRALASKIEYLMLADIIYIENRETTKLDEKLRYDLEKPK